MLTHLSVHWPFLRRFTEKSKYQNKNENELICSLAALIFTLYFCVYQFLFCLCFWFCHSFCFARARDLLCSLIILTLFWFLLLLFQLPERDSSLQFSPNLVVSFLVQLFHLLAQSIHRLVFFLSFSLSFEMLNNTNTILNIQTTAATNTIWLVCCIAQQKQLSVWRCFSIQCNPLRYYQLTSKFSNSISICIRIWSIIFKFRIIAFTNFACDAFATEL